MSGRRRRIGATLAIVLPLLVAGCGGGGTATRTNAQPSQGDVDALQRAFIDVTQQCVAGIRASLPGATSTGADVTALSRDVTTMVTIYKRSNPNAVFQASGAMTVRQYIDQTIAFLDKSTCAPSVGQRLATETP